MQIIVQKFVNICKIQKNVVYLRAFCNEEDYIHITAMRAMRIAVHGYGSGCQPAYEYIRYSG